MSLNVYRKYPESCRSLTNIEKVCSDRIKLYKILEAAKYNRLEVGTLQWSNYIISKIQEVELKSYYVLLGLELQYSILKAKREDNLAHWMVGLKFQKKVVPNLGKYQFLIQDLPKYIPKLLGCELDGVDLINIDQIAHNHFPLCMQNLHHTLRTNHHLKYDGKMQYGVFLYWLGLSYEDAIKFWMDEFTQSIPEDLFNRKYLYLFQHQYGKIGRKKPYAQFYCSKILEYSPLPSQHHGCPFKHWSKSILFERLESEVSCLIDIEDLVTQKDYQKACTTYLCKSRKVPKHVLNPELDVIESPIQYVNQSFKVLDVLDVVFDSDENILNI